MPDVRIPTIDPSPAEDGVLAGTFQARGKASFLTAMLRSLSAGSRALMYYGPGSLPHRIVEALAIELSQLSFDVRRLAVHAIREAGYRAFRERRPLSLPPWRELLLRPRPRERTAATVHQRRRDRAGDLMGTGTGLTVRVLENTVLKAGQASVLVPVASEVAGRAGYVPAGALTTYLQNSALRVTNPAAITGGEDEETDEALHARFGRYIRGDSDIERALGPECSRAGECWGAHRQASGPDPPLAHSGLNREMGYGYVVIDAGGGSAPQALLDDAQPRIDQIVAAAQDVRAISCNPYAVDPERACGVPARRGSWRRGPWTAAAFRAAFGETPIEDGSGRGALRVTDIKSRLDAVGGVLTVTFPEAVSGVISVPVAARAVEGALILDLYRGV